MNKINTEHFPCFRCGVCCCRYQVRLPLTEAHHIAGQLQVSWTEFVRQYTDPRWPDPNTFLIRHRNGTCIFLEFTDGTKESRCLIHSFRPQDCRDWTPGLVRPECQQGLAQWGLTINTSGEIAGTADKLREFQSFLNSLG